MKTANVLRHVHFEDLGAFAAPIEAAGYSIRYYEMGVDHVSGAASADLLVVLGGPIGAYEDAIYPFLEDEIALIATRLSAGQAVLGICLGAQLMARALNARVHPGPAKEIGWKVLSLTPEGEHHLGSLKDRPVLHWHGDMFELPDGATNLASTELCPNQAFVYGAHALAFQFHPEATVAGFERWLIGHACEIGATPNVSVARLRADTKEFADASAQAGSALLAHWLARLPNGA